MLTHCPECKGPLHVGQGKFPDGLYSLQYCKKCGFKTEKPLTNKDMKF
ncbi:MAG TPA: hypothetical protein HA360_05950 [Nanoarchaeota archaeon]|nr:hypothetical protein [Candidatus Woesearchaeota archaeon]HIH15544.1 hypothetical protein [Nanoarchaeota archaeon]HIH59124.1 hypothetical protein [Nanoarchaeota archaeon]HII14588.1 hypothetical protein [Nanoarchaeota archaeon]HIJ05469.1 hypothetical protein [Nanoarchaeota archaeon]